MKLMNVSEFIQSGLRRWRHGRRNDNRIWLNSDFRVRIIKKGIQKAGSINNLGRVLGYRSRVHPGWSIRQILLGRQSFPYERLKALSEFLEVPIEEILKHRTSPEHITIESTRKALQDNGLLYYLPR